MCVCVCVQFDYNEEEREQLYSDWGVPAGSKVSITANRLRSTLICFQIYMLTPSSE